MLTTPVNGAIAVRAPALPRIPTSVGEIGYHFRMKLLLFSDLHNDPEAAQHIVKRSLDFDILVGAGDFGVMRRGIDTCIAVLKAIETPTVVVPGNAESVDELARACEVWPEARVLHGSGVRLQGQDFYGLGGGVPETPFGSWSYDFSEQEARELLADCPDGAVLVSHSPPQGAADVSPAGDHLGSVALREIVERTRPVLVVCGHIHHSAGTRSTLSNVPVVNAGPGGIEIELP